MRRHFALSTLALLLAPSCTAPQPRSESAPPPDLAYTFALRSTDPPRVDVSARFLSDPSGTSAVAVAPAVGDVGSIAELIHDLEARDASGAPLPLAQLDDRRWSVAAPPGTEIELRWHLDPLPEGDRRTYGNDYRPIVTAELFHTVANNALVWPEWMEEGGPRAIEVAWSGFAGAGWTVACSFGTDQDRVRAHRSLPEFRSAVFLAGGVRIHTRQLGDTVLCCALLGDRWRFRDAELVDLAARIVAAEREFFADPGPPFYLISLLPTAELPPGSFSLGGTALTDSFALFVMDGIALEPGSDTYYRIARLLAHEHMHTWTGRTIAPTDPEELVYWFTEGFTEFYTGRLLLAAGLITPEQRVATLNETLAAHWTSPVRDAPNERIRDAFWTDPQVQRLPYARGELVALRLDHEIRRASGGTRSLDDFLRELLAEARGPERPRFSTDDLLARAARWTSPALADELRRTLVDGEELVLPPATWSEWLALERHESAFYALGFDREESFQTGKVSGVVEGSPAWQAGLRDGQRVRAFRGGAENADVPVHLTIHDESGEHELQWLPRGAPLEVPAFVLVRPGVF